MSQQVNENEFSQEIDLLQYAKVLLHYWWIIGPMSLIGAGLMMAYSMTLPKKYRAECRFEIFENQVVQISDRIKDDYWVEDPMEKHMLMLRSSKLNTPIQVSVLEKFPKLKQINLTSFSLNLNPVKGAQYDIIDISVDSYDKEASLEYLKQLIPAYEKLRISSNSGEVEATKKRLQNEVSLLDKQIDEVEKEIIDFKTRNNFVFVSTKSEFDQKYIAELLEKANKNQFALDILKPELARLDKNPELANEVFDQLIEIVTETNNRFSMSQSGLEQDIQQWKSRQLSKFRIEAQLKIMLKKYKLSHPKVVSFTDELEIVEVEQEVYRKNILSSLKGKIKTLEAQNKNYLLRADQIEDTFGQNAGVISQLEAFVNKQQRLSDLRASLHESLVSLSGSGGDKYFTRMLREPFMYGGPVWPQQSKYITKGFLVCFCISSALILLNFFLKVKRYNFSRISRENKLPCLATIPHFPAKQSKKNPFFLNEISKSSVLAESYRSLRLFMEKNMHGKIVLFTSFGPSEGKTSTSLNTALCCSWTDKKVLLIDGDFRRVTLRKVFTNAKTVGLMDYLKKENSNIDEYISKKAVGNLDYLPAGTSDEYITELIDGKKIQELFSKLRSIYDLIIIDSAPAVRVIDTVHLAEIADSTVIVVRAGKTLAPNVSATVKRLPKEKLLGFVINGFKSKDIKFTGGDQSSHGYGYGYTYNYKDYNKEY
ncbi:polysaccharide biosynthesis tyrosine autokinase [Lentisphaera marina]|uniref:polysaccharide biosynthesis tyrosine autokinase n=1 Tax=Lentisphaera marina TaxID=1111041 RepID=UPI00236647BC|nr:polysaccharide biosynthesis tyrosine autokinase [Lentisphaera marina]MDD7986278.1 polysaccharide biosynthesis tyrosine autokinase [Lentisphaera marina]